MRRLLLGIAFIVLASSGPAQAGPVLEDVVSTRAHEEHPTASARFEARYFDPGPCRGKQDIAKVTIV